MYEDLLSPLTSRKTKCAASSSIQNTQEETESKRENKYSVANIRKLARIRKFARME